MNKLQLYITKSGHNYSSLLNLNPSEDVSRYVRDLRGALSLIEYDADEKNIFYLLSATDEGTFFTIIRTVPPVRGHHIAEWIFVPNNLEVSCDELYGLIMLMTRKASLAKMTNNDVAEVRAAFNAEYPAIPDAPLLTACTGTQFAWRVYGGDSGLTLQDYAGRGRWQQGYIPYAGVLLVDSELGYTVKAQSLAETALGGPAVILPPEAKGDSFSAYVFNRRLTRPLRATLGCDVDITWRRNGFEDVKVTEHIGVPDFMPVPPDTTGSHKLITPASFYITSQVTHTPVPECQIRVNGFDIPDEGRPFTGDDLRHAAVSVSCEGFATFTGTMDLAATSRALISLKEQRKVYCFELPLVNSDYGAPVRFELHTKRRISQSPVDGYILLDDIQEGPARTNYLGYAGASTPLSSKLLYGAIGLVAGIVMMLLVGLCSGPGDQESTLAPAADPKAEPTAVVAPPTPPADDITGDKPEAAAPQTAAAPAPETNESMADALKYLNDNRRWTKSDLEKYAATRGLFDDLNHYRVDRIVNVWGPKFKDCERIQLIVDHLQKGVAKKKSDLSGTYNRDDDEVIVIQSYLNRVDP